MAAFWRTILFAIVTFILHENAECKKDWRHSLLRLRNTNSRNSWHGLSRQTRQTAPTAKEKETNQQVLAALYGGLGLGIPSVQNFDYANGLNSKIQTAGGYGIPPGIFSYAFDPTTGMPFMCDPTKTPPGGKSQVSAVAAVMQTATVKKPAADTTSEKKPTVNAAPVIKPPEKSNAYEDTRIGTESPSGKNTHGMNASPEHIPWNHVTNNDPATMSGKSTTVSPGSEEITPAKEKEQEDDLMTSSSSPSNQAGNEANDATTPDQDKTTSDMGSDVSDDESTGDMSDVKPPRVKSSRKGVGIMLGTPLYVKNQKTNSHQNLPSSAQSKMKDQRLTPLIDNIHHNRKIVKVLKRSNGLKEYIKSKKAALKKNAITIKLPEIPPCPDMKQYHWPWNCLEKGKVKKDCIQNYRSPYSYDGTPYTYDGAPMTYANDGQYFDNDYMQ